MEGKFVKIKKIEEDGIEDVYCMTVEETENFIANDMVTHNCRYAVHTHYGSKTSLKEITQEEARTAATQRAWNSNPMMSNGLSPGSFGWQKY